MDVEEFKLPGNITFEALKKKTPKERFKIAENTKYSKLFSVDEKQKYLEIIHVSGPVDGRTAGSADDPFHLEMEEIINSTVGRKACVDATAQGMPALAGVEPMIIAHFGDEYAQTHLSTMTAGSLVGQLMRELGYDIVGRKPMPADAVAKTAAVWGKRRLPR
jgi:hypothetical protein